MLPLYCGQGEVLDSHPRLKKGFVGAGVGLFAGAESDEDNDAIPFLTLSEIS
jgi:hypothetical protein